VATDASPLTGGPSRRLLLAVVLAAVVAAAAVVGATLLQTRGESTTVPGAVTQARPGRPLLLQFEFGVRNTPEIRALAQAEALYDAKQPRIAQASAVFRRYHSVEAQLGSAFTGWTGPSSLGTVQKIADANPNDPAALLNLGWADYQAGRNADAAAAWRETASRFPDSPYAVDAEDALHGGPRYLPPIVFTFNPPKAIASLPAAAELAALKRAASGGGVRAKLLYGAVLWNILRRPVSARREFAAAARLAPHDPEARAAAAVSLFSKANPTPAFAHLGPLTGVFPHTPAVEFHLGVALVYIQNYGKAVKQLRAAVADGAGSPYAQEAQTLLASLIRTRSK
jgi:TolA-binding protein